MNETYSENCYAELCYYCTLCIMSVCSSYLKGWCTWKNCCFKMSEVPIFILGICFYKNVMHISCIKRVFCYTNFVPDPCLELNGHHSYRAAPQWWGCSLTTMFQHSYLIAPPLWGYSITMMANIFQTIRKNSPTIQGLNLSCKIIVLCLKYAGNSWKMHFLYLNVYFLQFKAN